MHINAINSLEIRFVETPGDILEPRLRTYRGRFELEHGCIGFSISRSTTEPNLWLLTGHWASTARMTEHTSGKDMEELVSMLVQLRASLIFSTFCKVITEHSSDVH